MLKISIPTPCNEDWNKMTPNETGRHCSSCAKSVVDFTGMSDYDVQHFFLNKKEEETCGRFKQSQLQHVVIKLPENILRINMPIWKKFLAACLIVFSTTLFSCKTNVLGAMKVPSVEIKSVNSNEESGYVGGLMEINDSIPVPLETLYITTGDIFILDSTASQIIGITALMPEKVDVTISEEIKDGIEMTNVADTTPMKIIRPDEMISDTILMGLDKRAITNQSKPDSTACNTIKNYH